MRVVMGNNELTLSSLLYIHARKILALTYKLLITDLDLASYIIFFIVREAAL